MATESQQRTTLPNLTPKHREFQGHAGSIVTIIRLGAENIYCADDEGFIHVYDTATGRLNERLDGHTGGIWAMQCYDHVLVTGSTDSTVRIWDLQTLRQAYNFTGHASTVRALEIVEPTLNRSNGNLEPPYPLIVTGSRDATLRVWRLPGIDTLPSGGIETIQPENNTFHLHLLEGHTSAVREIAASGRTCISGSYDSTVRVWDVIDGRCEHVLRGHADKIYSVAYDQGSGRCFSGSMDNSVRVWDVRTGECLAVLSGHTSLVGLINSSGIHVLSAAADGRVNVWNVISGDLQHTLPHPSAVVCLASDEDRAVTASGGTVQMWDISSGVSIWDACVGNQVWNIVWKQGVLIVASRRNNVSMFDLYDFR